MNRAGRSVLVAAAALIVVVLLFTVVFPWVDRRLIADPVLEGSGLQPGESAGSGG